MDEQLLANVLNIDFFVYSVGRVVSDNRQANMRSKSNGERNKRRREGELAGRTLVEMTEK